MTPTPPAPLLGHIKTLRLSGRDDGPVEDMQRAADEIERLTAENAALRDDAERYRWLRNTTGQFQGPEVWIDGNYHLGADVDAAIDAARALCKAVDADKLKPKEGYGNWISDMNRCTGPKDWREAYGFYPTDEPCCICGNRNAGAEPRFGYVVCEKHRTLSPVQVSKQRTDGK